MTTPHRTAPIPPGRPLPGVELTRALRDLAEEVARAAGQLVRRGRPDHVDVTATKSSPTDVVTAMDLAAEDLLRSMLTQRRPGDGVLGEERGLEPGSTGLTWVLDPIDGTVNYLYGVPAYAVSVAVVAGDPDPDRWTPVAACVHGIVDGRTFTAGRGLGAWVDGRPLHVGPVRPLAEALVGTGFGYTAARRRGQARVVADLLPRVRDIRRMGAASLDLCAVAGGTLDAYYERGLRPWDHVAGGLVATEAGALVTGLRGRPAGEAMTVAGPAGTVRVLVEALESLDADSD